MAIAKLFDDGDEQVLLLPDEFRLPGDRVGVHRDGDRIILTPLDPESRSPRPI